MHSPASRRNRVLSCWLMVVGLVGVGCGPAKPTEPGADGGSAVTVMLQYAAARAVTAEALSFSATVTGATDPSVTWSVAGVSGGDATVGTIDASGHFVAPAVVPQPAIVTVRATSVAAPSAFAEVGVTVVDPVVGGLLAKYSTGPLRVEGPLAHGQSGACSATGGLEYEGRCRPASEVPVNWAGASSFSVEWAGWLLVPAAGSYHFESGALVNGQVRVEVAGTVLADLDARDEAWSADVPLTPGQVPVRVTFAATADPPRLRLSWRGLDGVVSLVPRAYFVPRVGVTVDVTHASVEPGGSQTFTATVLGSHDTTVAWSLEAGTCGADAGSVTASGVYTAGNPSADCEVTVVATSAADSTATGRVAVTVRAVQQTPPTQLDAAANMGERRLVMDAAGNALAAWVIYGAPDEVWGARYDAGSHSWGAKFPLHLEAGNHGARDLALGGNAAGHAFIVYVQRYEPVPAQGFVPELWVRSYDLATGVLGSPHTLDAVHDDMGTPTVTVGPTGDAVAAWYRDPPYGQRLMLGAGFSATTGTWSASRRLDADDPTPGATGASPTFSDWSGVAVDAEGNGTVIWSHQSNDGWSLRSNRWLAASRTWEGERVVRPASAEMASAEHVVSLGTTVAALWAERSPTTDTAQVYQAVFDRTATAWGSPQLILDPAENIALSDTRSTGSGQGEVVLAWAQAPVSGAEPQLWAMLRSAAGTWSAPQRLDTSSTSAGPPALAMNAAGRGAVAWAQAKTGETQRLAHTVRLDAAAGTFSPLYVLGTGGFTGTAHSAMSVAVDGLGEARLLWGQNPALLSASVP